MRQMLLIAVLLLAGPAFAEDKPFITSKDLDIIAILPPPPANGSAEDKAQQALVIAVQKAASKERIALAEHDVDEDVFTMFAGVLGPNFKKENLPLATPFFARIGDTEDSVVDEAKKVFGRVRPWVINPAEIPALTRKSSSPAYPSGHTTRVTMTAAVLAAMLPEKREALWARAREYAESRVVGGMHYPNDLDGGVRAGSAIAGFFWSVPEFRAEYAPARAEVRHALGL